MHREALWDRRQFIRAGLAAGLLGAVGAAGRACRGDSRRPNVIFILGDDLGWAELGCYGNTFNETPNLDHLAQRGIRFTQAYAAAPVCSPYRASLMTGQWPARVGITDYLRPDSSNHLATGHVTLAEAFQQAGYTTGIIGKWHLTGYAHHGAEEVGPNRHGFDEVIVSERRGIAGGSYWHPYHFNPAIEKRLDGREYLVDRVNLEAVEFIERHRGEPFFLYVSHYAVHTRLVGRPKLVAKYEAKPGAGKGPAARVNNPHLAAQLESIDQGVGRIVETLERCGLAENTILVFTGDNGGEDRVTTNGPLRAGKSTLYEGGLRVPLIVYDPRITSGKGVCHEPVCSVDHYPTLCELTGIRPDARQHLDGVSLAPLLQQPGGPLKRDTLYWHYPLETPHFLGGRNAGAIRQGDWKLIEFFDTGRVELYNLAADLSEKQDLADVLPNRAASLRRRLAQWRQEMEADHGL